jgi:serine/threonine-protein kinase
VPAAIARLGARCLAADPADRPAAAEIAAALTEQSAEQSADEPADRPAEPAGATSEPGSAPQAAPDDHPGDDPDRPALPAGRPRTSVLVDPGGVRRHRARVAAGAAAAIALAVAFVVATTRGSGDRPPPAAGPTVTVSPAVPTAPSTAPPAVAPAGALKALTEMRRSVDEGAASGQVRSDVAVDFDNLISQLLDQLSTGQPVDDFAGRVGRLRVKIDQRLREGGLTAERAQDLRATLSGIA